jgi:ligand-binding sensor domain-containing protein
MKRLLLSIACLLLPSCSHEEFFAIPRLYVYNIQQHNGSIYFSTLDSGLFRFSPDHPEAFKRIAGKRGLPLRSIAIAKDGSLYVASYQDIVHYYARDTILPLYRTPRRAATNKVQDTVNNALRDRDSTPRFSVPQRAWSIKIDDDGVLWIAGLLGIFRARPDSTVRFGSIGEVHDIAFFGEEIAVAHAGGISLFAKNSGALTREFCKGVNCWTIARYDSLLVGGGANVFAIIDKGNCRTIPLGPGHNLLWSTARDASGTFYCATQKGLYRVKPGATRMEYAGFRGECIKSLLVDTKGRLWVGRFSKNKRYSPWWRFGL